MKGDGLSSCFGLDKISAAREVTEDIWKGVPRLLQSQVSLFLHDSYQQVNPNPIPSNHLRFYNHGITLIDAKRVLSNTEMRAFTGLIEEVEYLQSKSISQKVIQQIRNWLNKILR